MQRAELSSRPHARRGVPPDPGAHSGRACPHRVLVSGPDTRVTLDARGERACVCVQDPEPHVSRETDDLISERGDLESGLSSHRSEAECVRVYDQPPHARPVAYSFEHAPASRHPGSVREAANARPFRSERTETFHVKHRQEHPGNAPHPPRRELSAIGSRCAALSFPTYRASSLTPGRTGSAATAHVAVQSGRWPRLGLHSARWLPASATRGHCRAGLHSPETRVRRFRRRCSWVEPSRRSNQEWLRRSETRSIACNRIKRPQVNSSSAASATEGPVRSPDVVR